jgi:hypothetical protein
VKINSPLAALSKNLLLVLDIKVPPFGSVGTDIEPLHKLLFVGLLF